MQAPVASTVPVFSRFVAALAGDRKNTRNGAADSPAFNWPMPHSMAVPSALLTTQVAPSATANTAFCGGSKSVTAPVKRTWLIVLPPSFLIVSWYLTSVTSALVPGLLPLLGVPLML